MSELQISLLGIGIAVILAVYLYNFWLQRQYQRKFGSAFKQHEDALYHGDKQKNPAAAYENMDTLMDVAEPGQFLASDKTKISSPDEVCMLLDEMSDYIVEIFPISLAGADALEPLWQRRFDFGKNVNACGQNPANGIWEKVIADSHVTYGAFKLGLQLANRAGAVSASKLGEFRDMAQEIGLDLQAEMSVPDVDEAATRAIRLDEFCAEVDQMIGLNLLPNGEINMVAAEVAQVTQLLGSVLYARPRLACPMFAKNCAGSGSNRQANDPSTPHLTSALFTLSSQPGCGPPCTAPPRHPSRHAPA